VRRIALETSRARQELGWEAGTGLEDGLERTLASLR
jgi:nucleoside-diphosphate-sugar epimerase